MNHSFPGSIESLNCDWLSRVLKENGTLSCECVVSFSVEEIEGGYTSSVYMLSLKYDQKTGDFVLLLEDLSAARHDSWEVDLLADIKTALPQLAKIHAQFWNDPRLQKYEWVVKSTETENASSFKEEWSSNLHQAKKHYHDEWCDYACYGWLS